jgi:hypothetical protein
MLKTEKKISLKDENFLIKQFETDWRPGVNFTNILLAQLRQYSCETFVRKRRAQNVGEIDPRMHFSSGN